MSHVKAGLVTKEYSLMIISLSFFIGKDKLGVMDCVFVYDECKSR
jgi:hypothetical protein